jgi:hypothetical protein
MGPTCRSQKTCLCIACALYAVLYHVYVYTTHCIIVKAIFVDFQKRCLSMFKSDVCRCFKAIFILLSLLQSVGVLIKSWRVGQGHQGWDHRLEHCIDSDKMRIISLMHTPSMPPHAHQIVEGESKTMRAGWPTILHIVPTPRSSD